MKPLNNLVNEYNELKREVLRLRYNSLHPNQFMDFEKLAILA